MSAEIRRALLRTLAFHETWGHAPTLVEWVMTAEISNSELIQAQDLVREIDQLMIEHRVTLHHGRCMFSEAAKELIQQIEINELYTARKRKRAQEVTRWLARLGSVRFVALCNTTSLGHARDQGDLDFFVIVRAGSLMQTRGLAALPFKISGQRPGSQQSDAICLSYFISDDGLSLAEQMLPLDDPYFRYWFLSLLPFYDDGVSNEFWSANSVITKRHAFARKWETPPDLKIQIPSFRIPSFNVIESLASKIQSNAFPEAIKNLINQDTRVMVNDKVLKFHVDDRRAEYKEKYIQNCSNRGV